MKFAIRDRFIEALQIHIKQDLDISEDRVAEVLGIEVEEFKKIVEKKIFLEIVILAKFLMAFPEINPEWLLMGWGNVLRKKEKNIYNTVINNGGNNRVLENIPQCKSDEYKFIIQSLQKNIILQEEYLLALKRENELLRVQQK